MTIIIIILIIIIIIIRLTSLTGMNDEGPSKTGPGTNTSSF